MKKTANGTIIVQVSKRVQAEKILKWKTLDKIKTYPHKSLNASRRVIRSLNLTPKKKKND